MKALKAYKEIFSGLLLGFAMWAADAAMHVVAPDPPPVRPRAFAEELFLPEGPVLAIRLLYLGLAVSSGWVLWRLNRRERAVRLLERRAGSLHARVIHPAALIADGCGALLGAGGLDERSLERVREIARQAHLIDDFASHFPPSLTVGESHGARGAGVAASPGVTWPPAGGLKRLTAGLRRWAEGAAGGRLTASVTLMVAAGLTARLVAVWFAWPEQLGSPRGDFDFGWEAGRVARSLAHGQGFSSPFWGETGPTAWLPPVYPLLLAGVFKLCGVYSAASAVAILGLNSLFSALTTVPVVLIARKVFGVGVAAWAGWGWALFPYAVYIPAFRVWGESLDALLASLLLLLTWRMAGDGRAALWLGGGVLAGLAALTNPNALSFVPALWVWAVCRLRREGGAWKKPVLVALAALLAAVAPWFARNYYAFDRFVPFRSNFWLEARVGNNEQAAVMLVGALNPASNPDEMAEYRRLGEVEYMAEKRRQALAFVAARPGLFALLTLRRVAFVWTGFWSLDPRYLASEPLRLPFLFFNTSLSMLAAAGLFAAWRGGNRAAAPLALVLVFQPLVYYVTHPAVEYRHTVDPVVVVLAVVGGLSLKARCGAGGRRFAGDARRVRGEG
jgi:hypothetical protein